MFNKIVHNTWVNELLDMSSNSVAHCFMYNSKLWYVKSKNISNNVIVAMQKTILVNMAYFT